MDLKKTQISFKGLEVDAGSINKKARMKETNGWIKKKSRTPFKTYCRYTLALSRSMATGGTSTKQTSATPCPQALVALTLRMSPSPTLLFYFSWHLVWMPGDKQHTQAGPYSGVKDKKASAVVHIPFSKALLLSSHRQHNCRNSFFVFTSSSDWFV